MKNIDSSLITRLRQLDTSLISDVLDEAGLRNQALTSCIRALDRRMKLAGPAVCLRGSALDGEHKPDAKPVSAYTMDQSVYPGAILVVEAGQEAVGATIGSLIAISLVERGCAGVVNDGAVRDVSELVELNLPVFTRHVTPANASGRWSLIESEGAIELPGLYGDLVSIEPGDLVLADGDGIIIVPRNLAEPIILAAERLQAIESQIAAQLRAGEDREIVFKSNPRFSHVKPMMEAFRASAVSDNGAAFRKQITD